MNSKAVFSLGRIQPPLPVIGDAYTVSGDAIASNKARLRSVYNFTNRYSPSKNFPEVCYDERMVLYGLTDFIRNHLTRKVSFYDIKKSANFMSSAHSFGGGLPFNQSMWERVVFDYDGFLPIKIEALPEGSTFFPHEPIIQVTSLGEGFGEIAAQIEAVMVGMVSIATVRATLTRHWLERVREYVREDLPTEATDQEVDNIARFFIHDFGMRASSCAEESEMLGRAHLLSFHGTDTFNASYQAWQMGAKRPTGTSILALAHRIVQGYENDEFECYNNLEKVAKQDRKVGVASYVADCYNFKNAVNYLYKLSKANPESVIIVRSDSGDLILNDNLVTDKYKDGGNFLIINGDSINPEKMLRILKNRWERDLPATKCGIFGVGGYLRNSCTRDAFSSAYKLSAIGLDNQPVCKLAEDTGKMSVPGPNYIIRPKDHHYVPADKLINRPTTYMEGESLPPDYTPYKLAYKTYYDGSIQGIERYGDVCVEDFSELQRRTIEEFDFWGSVLKDKKKVVLSDKIEGFRQDLIFQYKPNYYKGN